MLWNALKKISFKEFRGLFVLCLKHPLYVIPTLRATYDCIEICNKLYGNTHHLHNPANAVRHALWNLMIAQYCYRWNRDEMRVLAWTHLITDWHEDFSVNQPLERAMDLHNNQVGRDLFASLKTLSTDQIVTSLQVKATHAVQIHAVEAIEAHPNQLVYLTP